ncbi:MAG TPA: FtsX-like permease family protein [Pyrinomonadaceae bacterium]|nr:FtsX-like permease family protein [Pyrinomonadaceae bacterium]
MMKALDLKMLRDLWHLRGQAITTALVVACGVATFVAMRSTYDSLLASRDGYYAQFKFADVFASLKSAPESVRSRIAAIEGVTAVETRVVATVTIDLPDVREPVQGRVVSVSESDPDPLNGLYLQRGRALEPGHENEVVISGAFADANGLRPGDHLNAVLNGRLRKLFIAGIALSPEFIYEIRPGDIFPDNRRFGIIWMNRKAAGSLFQLDNAFNDVVLTLGPSAVEADVIQKLDSTLEPYGGFGAYTRTDQYSHRFVSNELAELQVFGTFIPAVFLGVTAFLLHLVLSRLVNVEREQIGLLKSFGYSDRDVGLHYLKLAVLAVAGGIVIGIGLGAWLGTGMAALYSQYFHFPVLNYSVSLKVIAYSVIISIGAASAGAISAVIKAVSLPPAEAMRPETPPNFHAGFLETAGFRELLSASSRMVVRNIIRRPLKAFLSSLGISLSVALLFIGFYFFDAIYRIIDIQFGQIQREDVEVTFVEPRSGLSVYDLASLPGVIRVEPYRVVPAILRSGNRSRRVGISGASNDNELRRIIGRDFRRINLPPEGIVLGKTIADSLGAVKGDKISVEVTEGSRPKKEVVVSNIADELLGIGVYMELSALNRLLNEQNTVSGAFLSIEGDKKDAVYKRLKTTPAVAGVAMPESTLTSFNETMARTIGTSTTFLIGFACIIAFGVVYNGARIALAERGRELASLRVLGYRQDEVGRILLEEQAILTAFAIPMGYVIGLGACIVITRVVDAEIIRLPIVFSARTFLFSGLMVAAAAIMSGILVSRRIQHMDLIAVLKTRE